MQTVKIRKNEFIESLRKNRKAHKKEYDEAHAAYRKAAILQLEKNLQDARDGKDVQRHLNLPVPEDHTEDYDRELRMVEMSAENVIELNSHEFDQYVMDNWNWKQAVSATNLFYKANLAR